MSKALEKATDQYQAGQLKKAVATLWEATFAGDAGETEARGVLALAVLLRDATDGGVRGECEEQISRAERFLRAEEQAVAQGRVDRLETELRQDPVRLANWARETGLRWLEVTSAEDLVAAQMRDAMALDGHGAPPPGCIIDAVEAVGWRLENVACVFKPTRLQTSPLRGADVFMGGDVVEGEEKFLYLFRRVDGASD